jgi:hypothetical protein
VRYFAREMQSEVMLSLYIPLTLCNGVLAKAENTISGGGYTVLLAL